MSGTSWHSSDRYVLRHCPDIRGGQRMTYIGDVLVWLRHQHWAYRPSRRTQYHQLEAASCMRCLVTLGGFLLTLQLTRSSTWQSQCSIEVLAQHHLATSSVQTPFNVATTTTDDIGICMSWLWDSAADRSEWAALRPIAGFRDWLIDWRDNAVCSQWSTLPLVQLLDISL